MRFFKIIKAKKKIDTLYQMINEMDISELPFDVLGQNEDEIRFRYENVEGKILISDSGVDLYTLFDIYDHTKLIKGAYRYDPRPKSKNSGEMPEFSRSGAIAPGPC
ncbi:MAG: hypothetical protein JEZ08_08645 [Clostridiales bacterium]|nr:hypothetical protein [Clostridiales bacterium]